ncbi:hypothetical protein DID88_003597 [Monilinia fructigena]|uniref:Uncharacterized protein n=1 Tax=Monilinia fructigena TaxID=38457 RepID=A0A395IVW9_9HELO|nr:hypothetical protein DID88_003597 [Monilinia fructigena]
MTPTCKHKVSPPLQLLPQTQRSPILIHQTTAHKLASLLQEVASIMDTITGEKMMCGEELDDLEGDVLGGLTEMVLIMEEEVEGIIELSDVLEEYVEELELADLDGWVADLIPSKSNCGINIEERPPESLVKGLKNWKGNLGTIGQGDGKESIRIGLDDGVKGRINLGGLLEEVEEDVLGWNVRGMSVNSDYYGSNQRSEVIIEAGVPVPITNYRKEDVIKQAIISLPLMNSHVDTKFRDSGLGLMSPVGVARRSMKKESKVIVKSSPIGLRTGIGSIRKKKTIRKPQ